MRLTRFLAALLAISATMFPIVACGQGRAEPSATKVSPLGVRQQRVEQMVEELQRKFTLLTQALQEKEPERAARLKKTLDEAKAMLLQQRAGEIARLLDQAQLDTASDNQKAVLNDIRALLALLLDEKNDKDKNREEFERLQQWKRDIEKIVQAERGEKRESDKIANKEKTLAELAARIKAIEALIEQQKQVIAATESARSEGIQGLGKISSQQGAVRKEAEGVAEQIAKEAGDSPPAADPNTVPPSDTSAKPAEGTPAESGKPGSPEGASADSATAPSAKPARPPEPAEKPLRQAIGNQRSAEQNLQQGKGKAAQTDEQTALESLQRALDELKKESSRIASLPPEAFEKMAGKQDDIANQTAKVQEGMKQAAEQAAGQSGKPGANDSGSGKQPPGQQKVQQAQKAMQQASGDLRKQDPSDASRQQGKAIKELEEALREIEERLAQLREETQIEKLARLEARFREMLARQQKASADTIAMESKRVAEGELKRSDRLAVGKIAAEERALGEAAQQALDIIIDDGTSVVFPDVVEQVRDDLINVGKLIDGKRTDAYTQSQQKEIELTLQELIDALQLAQKQKEGAGGGGGGGGEPPLLPGSAELKLLRAAQLRVNRRTLAFDSARQAADSLDDVMKQEIATIANRQAEIGEMTIRILERGQ